MFLREILAGLQSALGSFGRNIISGLQAVGGTVRDALHLAEAAEVEVSPAVVAREWGEVKVVGGQKERFAVLTDIDTIPRSLYAEAGPWQKKRYSYEYEVYGRDLGTGRFAHKRLNLASSRELLPGEVEDYAREKVNVGGESPMYNVFSVALVGATHRAEQSW